MTEGTWGRMDYLEAFSIVTTRISIRFSRIVRGERRHVDVSVRIRSLVGLDAARVVWADRAEAAFDVEERAR